MNPSNEVESRTIFFDRTYRSFRVKRDGSLEMLGGLEGGTKVRIIEDETGDGGKVVLHFHTKRICLATIDHEVEAVSHDGLTVHLILFEEGVHHFTRQYILTFHEERAAKLFVDAYEMKRGVTNMAVFEEKRCKNEEDEQINFYTELSEDLDGMVFKSPPSEDKKEKGEEDDKLADIWYCDGCGTAGTFMNKCDCEGFFSEKDPPCNSDCSSFHEDDENFLPPLDDFSQDVLAQNMLVRLPKKW